MADSNFQISPVPTPQPITPLQIPQPPDPTALIFHLTQLQERKQEFRQKNLNSLVESLRGFAGLAERQEEIERRKEQATSVLQLKVRDEERKDEELNLAKRRADVLERATGLKPIPPEAGRFVGFIDRGLDAIGQMRGLIKDNPDIVKQATSLNTVKSLPVVGGVVGPLVEAKIGGVPAQVFNNLNQELMDPEIRIKTGAALNREEWDFYEKFILKFFDLPGTVDFKLARMEDLLGKVKTQLQSGTRTPGISPGEATTDSSLKDNFKTLLNPKQTKLNMPPSKESTPQIQLGKKTARYRLLELTKQGYPDAMVDAILEQELSQGIISK